MKTVELKVFKREGQGKGYAKKIRRQEKIPAVLYGGKTKPVLLEVGLSDLEKVLKTQAGGNVILTLKIEGLKEKKDHTVIIKEIQVDPVHDQIYHLDFNAISLTEKIHVRVVLHEKGEAPGVKNGGVVDHVHREVEVECLPTEIPEKIDVDVSNLNIGDAIHVKDLVMPSNVICVMEPEEVLFTCLAPMKEEAPKPEEEAAPTEPEVIGKKKPEVEGEEVPEAQAKEKEKEKEKGKPAAGKKE